jgi:hypothetical protein
MIRILVGVCLIVVLFIFFVVMYNLNSKVKVEKGFTLKGYNSKCGNCTSKNCPLYDKGECDE